MRAFFDEDADDGQFAVRPAMHKMRLCGEFLLVEPMLRRSVDVERLTSDCGSRLKRRAQL